MQRLVSRHALQWWIIFGAIGGACVPFVTGTVHGGTPRPAGEVAFTLSANAALGALALTVMFAALRHLAGESAGDARDQNAGQTSGHPVA